MKKKAVLPALALSLAVFFVLILVVGRRLWDPGGPVPEYAARIEVRPAKNVSFEGGKVFFTLKIVNRGRLGWRPQEPHPYSISYHILDANGAILKHDNRRYPLPQKVRPARSVEMRVALRCPLEAGRYILEFDLLREGLLWFKDRGSKTAKVDLLVKKKTWPEDVVEFSLDYGKYTRVASDSEDLNKIFRLIRLTLEENAVSFQGRTGEVFGFAAGTDYPQVWLRDANTIIPASRYYYGERYLYSWLEEHLAIQSQDGSLSDWVDAAGHTGKNTTATDQEASAVQAAAHVSDLLGPDWLEKEIHGRKIIDRLELALDFVFRHRFSTERGLIKGAHTADWGDVDAVDADEQAVEVDDRTHWTVDIYDQGMVFQACLNLADMLDALGHAHRAEGWRDRAALLKSHSTRWLWQADRGFFRVHSHLDAFPHDFDEDSMFPMGGNVLAVLSGLADRDQSLQILQNALKKQEEFGVSTISGTLLPPYPRGFFEHPLLDDPFEYQNGAQWDWFGGRLVYAMFTHGLSFQARAKLLEIIRKNLNNGSFYEWDNREGVGHGSDAYCGSAGSLAKAVFEGYLGIHVRRGALRLAPRILDEHVQAHIYVPASDVFIAFEFFPQRSEKKIVLTYNSNLAWEGDIEILLHARGKDPERAGPVPRNLRVRQDGMAIPFRLAWDNEDLILHLKSDFKRHTIEVDYE